MLYIILFRVVPSIEKKLVQRNLFRKVIIALRNLYIFVCIRQLAHSVCPRGALRKSGKKYIYVYHFLTVTGFLMTLKTYIPTSSYSSSYIQQTLSIDMHLRARPDVARGIQFPLRPDT